MRVITILRKLLAIFDSSSGDNSSFSHNNITFFKFVKNDNSETLEVKDNNTLLVNLKDASDSKLIEVKKIIDESIQKREEIFLTSKDADKTIQIKDNFPKTQDKKILNFYKGKLDPEMLKAVEMSLIVKRSFAKHEDITELKEDIRRKYPNYGNNICNMVCSNYFHSHFKELYDNMSDDDDFDITTYQKKVLSIIISLPYTVFVSKENKYSEVSKKVKLKLENLMTYGTGKLLVHAIGNDNVQKVYKLKKEYERYSKVYFEMEINKAKSIVTATIKFSRFDIDLK